MQGRTTRRAWGGVGCPSRQAPRSRACAQLAAGKPAPDVYLEALRVTGCTEPARALAVEDAVNGVLVGWLARSGWIFMHCGVARGAEALRYQPRRCPLATAPPRPQSARAAGMFVAGVSNQLSREVLEQVRAAAAPCSRAVQHGLAGADAGPTSWRRLVHSFLLGAAAQAGGAHWVVSHLDQLDVAALSPQQLLAERRPAGAVAAG
jgi:beta-phosphoglucomutase-like phosphatase (HAD superfamily)